MNTLVFSIALLVPQAAFAAELQSSSFHRPANAIASRDRERVASIIADARVVLVPVTVTDKKGRTVTGLKPENFRLLEDGAPRDIISFGSEDTPISLGVVFDVSGSMRGKISQARSAVKAVLETVELEDEAFVMTFADQPNVQADFTRAFDSVANRLLLVNPGGSTALIDAVYLGLNRMRFARNPRKALLLISDGADNNSRYSESELFSRAIEADVQVYTIGINEDPRSLEERRGMFFLEKLSEITGGLHFMVRDRSELRNVAEKIAVAMRTQYVLVYKPGDGGPAGKWRKIRVKLDIPAGQGSLRVSARGGYYSPER